jgi:hypothetical protein
MSAHPPCGLYRTTRPLESVPAGRLVYFHNHGDPGAGIYLPKDWSLNRAQWHARGYTVPDAEWSSSLEPLKAEGLYRVSEKFFCCEKRCRTYDAGALVQLGYTGEADALLFVPEWTQGGLGFPERGNKIGPEQLARLEPLAVAQGSAPPPSPAGGLLH